METSRSPARPSSSHWGSSPQLLHPTTTKSTVLSLSAQEELPPVERQRAHDSNGGIAQSGVSSCLPVLNRAELETSLRVFCLDLISGYRTDLQSQVADLQEWRTSVCLERGPKIHAVGPLFVGGEGAGGPGDGVEDIHIAGATGTCSAQRQTRQSHTSANYIGAEEQGMAHPHSSGHPATADPRVAQFRSVLRDLLPQEADEELRRAIHLLATGRDLDTLRDDLNAMREENQAQVRALEDRISTLVERGFFSDAEDSCSSRGSAASSLSSVRAENMEQEESAEGKRKQEHQHAEKKSKSSSSGRKKSRSRRRRRGSLTAKGATATGGGGRSGRDDSDRADRGSKSTVAGSSPSSDRGSPGGNNARLAAPGARVTRVQIVRPSAMNSVDHEASAEIRTASKQGGVGGSMKRPSSIVPSPNGSARPSLIPIAPSASAQQQQQRDDEGSAQNNQGQEHEDPEQHSSFLELAKMKAELRERRRETEDMHQHVETQLQKIFRELANFQTSTLRTVEGLQTQVDHLASLSDERQRETRLAFVELQKHVELLRVDAKQDRGAARVQVANLFAAASAGGVLTATSNAATVGPGPGGGEGGGGSGTNLADENKNGRVAGATGADVPPLAMDLAVAAPSPPVADEGKIGFGRGVSNSSSSADGADQAADDAVAQSEAGAIFGDTASLEDGPRGASGEVEVEERTAAGAPEIAETWETRAAAVQRLEAQLQALEKRMCATEQQISARTLVLESGLRSEYKHLQEKFEATSKTINLEPVMTGKGGKSEAEEQQQQVYSY